MQRTPRIQRPTAGYTLVELVIVCLILAMFAALILPKAVKFKDAEVQRDAIPSIIRLIGYAREQAIAQRTTAVLSYDSSSHSLMVKQDTNVDPNVPTMSSASTTQNGTNSSIASPNGGPDIPLPTAPTVDTNNPTINKSAAIPNGLAVSSYQIAGKDVAESDFQLRFYQDGTCDSGGISLTQNTDVQSLVIDDFGRVTLVEGTLPDPSTLKWEAGAFEPRQQG